MPKYRVKAVEFKQLLTSPAGHIVSNEWVALLSEGH